MIHKKLLISMLERKFKRTSTQPPQKLTIDLRILHVQHLTPHDKQWCSVDKQATDHLSAMPVITEAKTPRFDHKGR